MHASSDSTFQVSQVELASTAARRPYMIKNSVMTDAHLCSPGPSSASGIHGAPPDSMASISVACLGCDHPHTLILHVVHGLHLMSPWSLQVRIVRKGARRGGSARRHT